MSDSELELETVLRNWSLSDADRERLMEIARSDMRAKRQLLDISRLLEVLLPIENARGWVHRENKLFDNKPALAVMCREGALGIERVFKYLMASM